MHFHIGIDLSAEDVEMLSPLLLDDATQELVDPSQGIYKFKKYRSLEQILTYTEFLLSCFIRSFFY